MSVALTDLLVVPKRQGLGRLARIRKGVNVRQGVFAVYLNTTASTIRQWEQGDKKPSGIAARMLQLVQKNGLEIFG
jgi:putative transcriptional regulator